jgi:hypothetical protein
MCGARGENQRRQRRDVWRHAEETRRGKSLSQIRTIDHVTDLHAGSTSGHSREGNSGRGELAAGPVRESGQRRNRGRENGVRKSKYRRKPALCDANKCIPQHIITRYPHTRAVGGDQSAKGIQWRTTVTGSPTRDKQSKMRDVRRGGDAESRGRHNLRSDTRRELSSAREHCDYRCTNRFNDDFVASPTLKPLSQAKR